MPAASSRWTNRPARGKSGNSTPIPASMSMVRPPLLTTTTFSAHSSTSGGRNMSSSQAARTAGSALWPNIVPGSDSTPSLTTITSISPTRSAYRDGTNSSSPGLMPSFVVIMFIVCVPFVVSLFMNLSYARRALCCCGVNRHRETRELHHLRRSSGEQFAQLRTRRINPDGTDLALGRLRQRSDLLQLRFPSPRENRARRPEIEAHHVGLLIVGLGRQAQQIGGRVVAGEGPEPDRELTGHRGNVAQVVSSDLGRVAGRKHILGARHAQVGVDDQAAQIVA